MVAAAQGDGSGQRVDGAGSTVQLAPPDQQQATVEMSYSAGQGKGAAEARHVAITAAIRRQRYYSGRSSRRLARRSLISAGP